MYSIFTKENWFVFFTVGVSALLCACENSKNDHQLVSGDAQSAIQKEHAQEQPTEQQDVTAQSTNDDAEGKKLSDVAGQAVLPKLKDGQSEKLSKQSLQFVGRYSAQIPCDDPFAKCMKGNAEFIINLLPNGSAHRTFVYMGKITNENNNEIINRVRQENTWFYDEKNHQIVVNRMEGIQFFYKVGQKNELIIDVDQILNGTEENKLYFKEHSTAPKHAYVLKKFDH